MGSGFLGSGAAAAAAAGQAIFLRRLSVFGGLELSVWEGFDGPRGEAGGFRHGFWSALQALDRTQGTRYDPLCAGQIETRRIDAKPCFSWLKWSFQQECCKQLCWETPRLF